MNLLHCCYQHASIVGIYLQCLYAISVSSSAVRSRRDGKEKYICRLSSKCAKHFQVYLPLRPPSFTQLLKSEPTHVSFFESMNELLKLGIFFSFYIEAISLKIHADYCLIY